MSDNCVHQGAYGKSLALFTSKSTNLKSNLRVPEASNFVNILSK